MERRKKYLHTKNFSHTAHTRRQLVPHSFGRARGPCPTKSHNHNNIGRGPCIPQHTPFLSVIVDFPLLGEHIKKKDRRSGHSVPKRIFGTLLWFLKLLKVSKTTDFNSKGHPSWVSLTLRRCKNAFRHAACVFETLKKFQKLLISMVRDTPLGFPSHSLPYRYCKFPIP